MSGKISTYISLIVIVLFEGWYVFEINGAVKGSSSGIGPQYFPNILFGALIILCLISFIQTIRKDDTHIKLPSIKLLLLTIAAVFLFILGWNLFGLLYVHSFLFLMILLSAYRYNKKSMKIMVSNLIISLCTTIFLYVLFDLIIDVRF